MKPRVARPATFTFGLGFLLRIRHDQLGFYAAMRDRGDAVRMRLGPYRSWLLFHPDDVEDLLERRWKSFIRFEKLTQVVGQWTGENMLLAEGDEWRRRRRKVLPAFQTRRLPGYGDQAVDHASRWCDALTAQARDTGMVVVNTDAEMARLTLDIAAATFFASDPPTNGDEIEAAIKVLSDTAFRESTAPFSLPDWLPLPAKRAKRRAIAVMDALVGGLVDRRLASIEEDHGDLLSMLVEQHRGDREAIRNDAMSLLIAGHETSGALLGWTFLCLARSTEWRHRLAGELSRVLGDRAPTAADLPALPLIRAVIEEVLRLYPPAYSLFLRRATEDVAMKGFTIARGDLVQVAPYTLQRDPRWFADPERFDPSRFLSEPSWPRFAYLPFGGGPRGCIGQQFGMIEACLATATILQRFHPVEGPAEVVLDPKFSLRPKGGLPIRWKAAA